LILTFERNQTFIVRVVMNRSIVIKSLRPELPNVVKGAEISEIELFQNEVLRPILKFQNEVLTSLFISNLKKRDVDFSKMNLNGKIAYVTNVIQKDLGLRNVLIGMVLGLLTVEEIGQYYQNETEYRRRISKMVIDRLADQLVNG
jgi:hypothetical protein